MVLSFDLRSPSSSYFRSAILSYDVPLNLYNSDKPPTTTTIPNLGFLFGYDIGGTSFVIASLRTLDWDTSSVSVQAAPLKTGWIVSSPAAGALLGTALLLYLDNGKSQSPILLRKIPPLGRRQELRYAGLFYCAGAVLEWIAPYSNRSSGRGTTIPWSWSYLLPFVLLSVGRWVYGLGIGFAMHGGPTYLAETTPASIRGRVVGGKELAIVLGMVSGYTTGALFCRTTLTGRREEDAAPETNNTNSWSNVYGSTIVLSLLMIVCSYKIPESARWLISQPPAHRRTRNHTTEEENEEEDDDFFVEDTEEQRIAAEVLQALEFVWKPYRVGPEYEALMAIRRQRRNTNTMRSSGGSNHDDDEHATEADATAAATNQGPPPPAHNSIWQKSYRPAVRAGLGLVCLQQITGQPSVLSYATPILAQVPGLSTNSSVVLALFKVLATSLSVALVETRGRKTLLYLGCSLMTLALLVLTFVPFENNDNTNENTMYNTTLGQSEGLNVQSYLILFGMVRYIVISNSFLFSLFPFLFSRLLKCMIIICVQIF